MRFFPEGKSRTLSALSLASAAFCAVMTFSAARDLLTMLVIYHTPAFYLGMAKATVPVQMPPLAGFMVRHMRLFFAFFFFLWLSGLVLSLGVWARREWARSGACLTLYLLAGAALLMLAYPWLAVPRPLVYGGISLAPRFNDAVASAAFFTRLTSFLGGGLCLWWALALDRGGLRGEFR